MNYRHLLGIFAFAFWGLQAAGNDVLSKYHVVPETDSTMQEVASKFEVAHKHGAGFEIIVPQKRSRELLGLVPNAELIERDIKDELRRKLEKDPSWLDSYHNFESVKSFLNNLASTYPEFVSLETYGHSMQGRPLLALKISDNVHLNEEEPELMITSSTHGDELISVEVVLGLIKALTDGYGKVDRITQMVEKNELYFIPVINPDGFVIQSRYANGKDPNREYPWPERPDRNPVDCIKHLLTFFEGRDFVGSMDFHASGRMIMYPWAYTYNSIPSSDERRFADVTNFMSGANGYIAGQISKVIYVAKGSSADYYYWKRNTFALGIEIGRSKVPHSSQIQANIQENMESTWRFIESF